MIYFVLSDPVEYLTHRKFPYYPEAIKCGGGRIPLGLRPICLSEIEAYQAELRATPPEELQALYEQEPADERREALAIAEMEDRERFFNRSYAEADFTHWSTAAYCWTLDEAIALSFGKRPEVVNWESVKRYVNVSLFAVKYSKVRDLALRAKACKELCDPVLPSTFLAWARRMKIEVPAELVEQFEARGMVIADWKDMSDKLKAQSDVYKAATKTLFAAKDKKIAELTQERDTLRVKTTELESLTWEGFDPDSDTYPPELDIAMLAWRAVTNSRDTNVTAKEQIERWLEAHYPERRTLSNEAKQRIAVICNWEKSGGRPRRDEK